MEKKKNEGLGFYIGAFGFCLFFLGVSFVIIIIELLIKKDLHVAITILTVFIVILLLMIVLINCIQIKKLEVIENAKRRTKRKSV